MIDLATVMLAIHLIPSECSLYKNVEHLSYCEPGTLGNYESGKDVQLIAHVVSKQESDLYKAVESLVFAAYESVFDLHAVGDGGKSYGAWQMRNTHEEPDVEEQFARWNVKRNRVHSDCGSMAAYVSGTCDHGTIKAGKRQEVVNRIVFILENRNQEIGKE